MSICGGSRDSRARAALYRCVVDALERSAELAQQHAERHQRNGRVAAAAYEPERARRARRIVARARSMLR